MHYIIIALVVIGALFGFGYIAGQPDNTAAIGEIASANSRATENQIRALENKLSGEIALSEARIQSELEKNRILSKHNTEKVLFAIVISITLLGAFCLMLLCFWFIFSELKARRQFREVVHLHEIGISPEKLQLPGYHQRLPVYRERG